MQWKSKQNLTLHSKEREQIYMDLPYYVKLLKKPIEAKSVQTIN